MNTLSLGEKGVEKGNLAIVVDAIRIALDKISQTKLPTLSRIADQIHKRIKIVEILGHFNSVSSHDHRDMPDDLADACTQDGIHENGRTLAAKSNLFISQWFDKELSGKEGLLHGTDAMFVIGPMIARMLYEDEHVQEIENIRFHLPVTNQLEFYVGEDKSEIDFFSRDRKPAITASIRTGKRQIIVMAFETDQPIERRAASNTFVQKICAIPFAEAIIDKMPPTRGIKLKKLNIKDQHHYDKLRQQNHVGMVTTTLLDTVVTAAIALGHAGHIPNENPLGGGFQNLVLSKPHQLTRGCTFAFTEIGEPKTTASGAQIYPLHFVFEGPFEEEVATGIFNWVSRPNN